MADLTALAITRKWSAQQTAGAVGLRAQAMARRAK